jgi:outer membrane protein TolC
MRDLAGRPAMIRSFRSSIRTMLGAAAVGLVAVPAMAQVPPLATPPANSSPAASTPLPLPEPKKDRLDLPLVEVPKSEKTLSLGECLAIGAEKQPVVAAAAASLRGAEVGYATIVNLMKKPLTGFIAPDLPYRLQQAERGLSVAQADVAKALQENRYDIVRLYYSFVYARQQDNTAADIVTQMKIYYSVAVELSKEPGKISSFKIFAMEEAINEIQKLRVTARTGQSLALAALKEAMGVEQCFDFVPRDTELPIMGGTVSECQVVQFAQTLRPELAMASAGVDAFRLEICAQGALKNRNRVPTLAAGSDLHSRILPVPHRNGEYRPGAIAPEMPTLLVGSRNDRVARACEISARQDTVYDKTFQLVTLEAINAFHNWYGASAKLEMAKARYERGKKVVEESRTIAGTINDQELLIRNEALGGKAQSEFIEAVFEHIKYLATLERVTAGGVKPAFPEK